MSSIHDVLHLCDQYDLIFLQETWLFKHELSILNNCMYNLKPLDVVLLMTLTVLINPY